MPKITQFNDFPVNTLKHNADIFTYNIFSFFIFCVNESNFPNVFKQVNITTALKRIYRGSIENYRPINTLPAIAKIFEKLLSKQGTMFIDQFFSKCGFWFYCTALSISNMKNRKTGI